MGEGTAAIDVGAGAGQATELLLEHGASPCVAVEPDPSFTPFLEARFGSSVEVFSESFEDVELPPATFDLAVAATSWHWVDQEAGLPKLASVLRPGGWWAAWWTVYSEPDRTDELHAALVPILGDGPPSGQATFCFDRDARRHDLEATGAFGQVEIDEWRWPLELDSRRTRALFATFSPILGLPAEEREHTLDAIADTVVRDLGDSCTRVCTTIMYTTQRC